MAAAAADKRVSVAAEDDAAIRMRFITNTIPAKTSGLPPFSIFTKSYINFALKAERGTQEEVETAYKVMLMEYLSMDNQMQKMRLACEAIKREQLAYESKKSGLEAEMQQAKQDIETKKRELQEARIVRQHNEEYETIRVLISEEMPRAKTQEQIQAIEQEISSIQAEGLKTEQTIERRRKQFALLLHVIEELQKEDVEDAALEDADMDAADNRMALD